MNVKPILGVSGLSIRRGNTVILENICWRVQPGEHWVIVGANGSGKTSLLCALTGYLTPTSGEVQVLGQRYGCSDWRLLRQRLGLVSSAVRQRIPPDEPALETIVSGRYAMIDFWGKMTPTDRRHARHILRQIECLALADRPWLFLSQGERQRVLIGRALMAKPAVLILDEPCAALDPAAREHFLQFLQRLGAAAHPPTMVLVTHHVEEIMPIFSHVLILKNARAMAQGSIKKTLTSSALSEAFGEPAHLSRRGGRYALQLRRRTTAWL
ncbi:MAG TPA: ABC transporter ATP-binding protein [Candidatus Cybelea sp.]|nr:ABC transporter ATP-binding protein [Candidatus Cybelea sp.]